MFLLAILAAASCVPVTAQPFSQTRGFFHSGLGSSFAFPSEASHHAPASTFLPSQPFQFSKNDNHRLFDTFKPQSPPAKQDGNNRGKDKSTPSGHHAYPDRSTGGNYPSHLAAKRGSTSPSHHAHPAVSTGGNYPSHLAAKHGGTPSGHHAYPADSMGGDYPSHLAAKHGGTPSSHHAYPADSTGGDYPSHLAAKHGGTPSGHHAYPADSMGGDYPSHLAAKHGGTPSSHHAYPADSMGGDYPSHLAAKHGGTPSGHHAYPADSTGGDYPSHLAAKHGGTPSSHHAYPADSTGGDYPSHLAAKHGGTPSGHHAYPADSMGGDYPSHLAAKKSDTPTGHHSHPTGSTGGNYPSHLAAKQGGTPTGQHAYHASSTDGDYPSRMAANQAQNQQQRFPTSHFFVPQPDRSSIHITTDGKKGTQVPHPYLDKTTGGNNPSGRTDKQHQQQHVGLPFSSSQFLGNFPNFGRPSQVRTDLNRPNKSPADGLHTYDVQTTGGDYPSQMAAKKQQQHQHTHTDGTQQTHAGNSQGRSGALNPISSSTPFRPTLPRDSTPRLPFSVSVPSNRQPFRPQHVQQVYPRASSQNQLYSSRNKADTNSRIFPASQPTESSQGVPKPDLQQTGLASQDSFSHGAAFPQCFHHQDLSASYHLSDSDDDYPTDAILSELRSKPYMAPMVGYETLPQGKSSSPFNSFDNSLGFSRPFSSFGLQDTTGATKTLGNVKHFPANFDENTLGQAMKPIFEVCPANRLILRSLKMDNNRCFVVNSKYQAISYSMCQHHGACSRCQDQGQGRAVSACVEQYNWVTVMIYCPHWERNKRVNSVRLYLPQSCTCNRFQC